MASNERCTVLKRTPYVVVDSVGPFSDRTERLLVALKIFNLAMTIETYILLGRFRMSPSKPITFTLDD